MTYLVFTTKDSLLVSNHTQVLCETLQEITNTILAYKLLELPDTVNVSLRVQPFEDDDDDMMSLGGCSVAHNLIELRIPPCYTTRTFITFIHELIHIHQGNLGYLREVGDDGFVWFDKFFSIRGITYEAYMNLPWERMAFREQQTIWNTIQNHIVDYAHDVRDLPDEHITINVVN